MTQIYSLLSVIWKLVLRFRTPHEWDSTNVQLTQKCDKRFSLTIPTTTSAVRSWGPAVLGALFTRMSTRPKSFNTRRAVSATWYRSVTSHVYACARSQPSRTVSPLPSSRWRCWREAYSWERTRGVSNRWFGVRRCAPSWLLWRHS